jgi:hypothetical protein
VVRYLPGIFKCLFISEIVILRLAAGNGLKSDCSNVSWCSCVALGQHDNYLRWGHDNIRVVVQELCVPLPFASWLIRATKVHPCMEHGSRNMILQACMKYHDPFVCAGRPRLPALLSLV